MNGPLVERGTRERGLAIFFPKQRACSQATQDFARSSSSIASHLKERDGTTLLQKPWPKFAKVFQSLLVGSFILFVAEKRVSTSVQKLSTPVLRWPLCRGLTLFNKSATIFYGLHSHQP